CAAGTKYTNLATVDFFDTHAIGLAGFGVEEGHVRNVDRHGFVDDAALCAGHRIRLDVLLDNVDAFDQNVVGANTAQHCATAGFIATGQYDDLVTFANFLHDGSLQHFWSQGHDLHELFRAQLARNGSEDAGADGFQFSVEQNGGVTTKLNQRAVFTAHALSGTNHYCVVNFAFLDASARSRILDANFDHVADRGITALRAAQHLDAHYRTRTCVVGHVQRGLHLYHDFSCSNLARLIPKHFARQCRPTSFGPVRFKAGRLKAVVLSPANPKPWVEICLWIPCAKGCCLGLTQSKLSILAYPDGNSKAPFNYFIQLARCHPRLALTQQFLRFIGGGGVGVSVHAQLRGCCRHGT